MECVLSKKDMSKACPCDQSGVNEETDDFYNCPINDAYFTNRGICDSCRAKRMEHAFQYESYGDLPSKDKRSLNSAPFYRNKNLLKMPPKKRLELQLLEMLWALPDKSFYVSKEWKKLRQHVLNHYGEVCMKCRSEVYIQVDHIKPRSIYQELSLDFDNMQVLCRSCNASKSNRIVEDWRPKMSLRCAISASGVPTLEE